MHLTICSIPLLCCMKWKVSWGREKLKQELKADQLSVPLENSRLLKWIIIKLHPFVCGLKIRAGLDWVSLWLWVWPLMIQSKNISPGSSNIKRNAPSSPVNNLCKVKFGIPQSPWKIPWAGWQNYSHEFSCRGQFDGFLLLPRSLTTETFLYKSLQTFHNPEFGLCYCFHPWLTNCRFIL